MYNIAFLLRTEKAPLGLFQFFRYFPCSRWLSNPSSHHFLTNDVKLSAIAYVILIIVPRVVQMWYKCGTKLNKKSINNNKYRKNLSLAKSFFNKGLYILLLFVLGIF